MNDLSNFPAPTRLQYGGLDRAYDFFNNRLFDGALPRCLITLQRKSKAKGFFSGDRFTTWDGTEVTDEIALNPATFRERTVEEILSTLVHEMVHLWQHHFGKAGEGSYHNKQWAEKMDALGLTPTDTGEPGGKRTGRRVTHIIAAGGPFQRECKALLDTGLILPYIEREDDADSDGEGEGEGEGEGKQTAATKAKKKAASKTKFTCPTCQANAWGKADLLLACGTHMVMMEPEPEEEAEA